MAGIAVNAIEFIIAFNIRNAQQRTKEMENSLRGLQSATASTFGGMISAAMGPFAGGATSIVSEIFGPMNQFAWNNKGSALQALADNPWGRATGGTQLFKDFRSSRSDLTATNRAQENFLGFIGNWSRKTGQSMSDQQQRGMFELFQFQEQAVEKEVDRARDNSFRQSTYGPFSDAYKAAQDNPALWESIKNAAELGFWNLRR